MMKSQCYYYYYVKSINCDFVHASHLNADKKQLRRVTWQSCSGDLMEKA